MRDYSKLLAAAKKNNGIIQTKIAVENKIPKDYLKYAVEDGYLEKVERSIYILFDAFEDDLYFLQLLHKDLVYSYETAAYFNKLTTRDPLTLNITTKKGNNVSKIKSNCETRFYFVKEENFDLGIIKVKTMFGNYIKIYDKERTLCDLFTNRYKGDKFIQIESLKTYLSSKDKNIEKLIKYAKILGVYENLIEKILILL